MQQAEILDLIYFKREIDKIIMIPFELSLPVCSVTV
jgi:hypothetical protein